MTEIARIFGIALLTISATWQPSVRLRLDRTVPLEYPLYDTIRTKVNSPLTVSRIRQRVEQEYDICLCVVQNECDFAL